MKTIDIKSNSRILHWAFYIFLFTVLSVGSVYASEDTPSVLSTNQSEKKTVKGNVMDENGLTWNTYHARPGKEGPRSSGIRRVHFDVDGAPMLDVTEERDVLEEFKRVETVLETAGQEE